MINNENGTPINIEIDEQTSKGIYSNFVVVSHNESEFVMDFVFVFPQQQKNKVGARVISSPAHTKRFLMALTDNVKKYEEKHGPIPV
ncbi:MAG: hypothetical protein A2044_07575 [Candidatus Firestonebacteria bacterium GWA2_43_8]|nr:MAG: hypothetical protein A2044_07575 [Candidatus Firestonebacteria bacterium GWA2_43_8]